MVKEVNQQMLIIVLDKVLFYCFLSKCYKQSKGCVNICWFSDTASTSDYDLTYSTLLNGGRIDEGCLPALNQSTSASKRRRVRRHPVWRFFKDVDGTKVTA